MIESTFNRLKSLDFFVRKGPRARPLPKLGSYAEAGLLQRHRKKILASTFLFIIVYTMAFQLFGRFMVVQFLAPLAVIAGMVIWALPEAGRAPTGLLYKLFFAFIVALLCWPDYLAIALPGMPWVTAIRLTGLPLMLIMLICLSVSEKFRSDLLSIINSERKIWIMLLIFTAIAFLSIFFSIDRSQSSNKFFVAIVNWVGIFFVACATFGDEKYRDRFVAILLFSVILLCGLAIPEWMNSRLPWADSIPSFLKIEDENVKKILQGSARTTTGIYRVQSKFTTPLGFAEFLAISAPFVLYMVISGRNIATKILACAFVPVIFFCIVKTDSRLGIVGFGLAFLAYFGLWSCKRWFQNRSSLFGPAITIAYPVIMTVVLLSTFFVGRIRNSVWGTGAQSFSTQAREQQLDMAIPKLLNQPWGYGIGQGADAVGFLNIADVLTLDSYYITIAMEMGVIGFIIYYGMFAAAIIYSCYYYIVCKDDVAKLLAPVSIALINFVVIKSVFSQQEAHPLVFAILGMAVALIWRVKQSLPPKLSDGRLPPAGYVPRQSRLVEDW